jgi:7-cyano-7-deazaguanine reductase
VRVNCVDPGPTETGWGLVSAAGPERTVTVLGMIETLENRFQDRDYLVELGAPEFTSICPMTGGPDFGELTIRYVPDEKLFELKSLRDYLTGFRERRILQEEVVNEVLERLVTDGAPRFVEVEGTFNARGGMTTRVVASSGEVPTAWISD